MTIEYEKYKAGDTFTLTQDGNGFLEGSVISMVTNEGIDGKFLLISGGSYYDFFKRSSGYYTCYEYLSNIKPLIIAVAPEDTLTRCQELAAEYNDSRFTVEYKQQVLESLIQLLTTGETI